MHRSARLVLLALIPAAGACALTTPGGGSPQAAHDVAIAELHAHKCGRCHAPPEPKLRTRAYLEAAVVRHRNRVRLTPAQWSALIDYLAAPVGPIALQER